MVHASFTAFLMALFWGSLMIGIFTLFLNHTVLLQKTELRFLLFFSLLSALRFILPVEFKYTIT